MKILSYGLIFCGLAHSMYELSFRLDATASELQESNQRLELEIVERAQVEAQLRASEMRLAEAQSIARIGSWTIDLQKDNEATWSDELRRLYGLDPSITNVTADLFNEHVYPDDRELVAAELRHAYENRAPFQFNFRVVRSDQQVRILEMRGYVTTDENNVPLRMWGTSQDVTEVVLAEQKVRQTLEKLQSSNRELEDFAYIASHDLQEPLRKIIAFTDRLRVKYGENLDATAIDYMDRVQHAARRMQALINDLLTLSRVTTRGQPFVPISLHDVVSEVLVDMETVIEQRQGVVEVGELPTVEADPSQMRQLFQNLISNALKFHQPEQLPVVRIHNMDTVSDVLGGTFHQIVVEDNGIGFDAKYGDRIFQPFQRLHGRDSQYEGTGMGLAICRKIVERHNGEINACSEVKAGAKFVISLPLKQVEPMEAT
jgi:signal transduction histidine kinase